MLQQIRKTTTDSIVFRILLGFLAVSFAAWGISDVLSGGPGKNIATFDDVEPLTYNEFIRTRQMEIKKIQQNSDQPISEEQIDEMGVNQLIIQNLVTNKFFEFLSYKYDLDFGDDVLANIIRGIPAFRNEDDEFDVEKFKSTLSAQRISEDEFSDNIRSIISRDIIMSSLVGNGYIPKMRMDNILSHMSEIRKVNVATMSLKPKADSLKAANVSDADLQKFYTENSDMFKTQEERDICYAKIDASSAKITVSDDEVRNFFDENKSEFSGQKFEKVKAAIKTQIQKDKLTDWIATSTTALTDEVAGGSTLKEIADKYGLKRICEKNISSDNIETRAGGLFLNLSNQISEMADKEVSYPLDLPKGNGQIMLEITKLIPEQVQDFDSVKDQVVAGYAAFLYQQDIMKKLQNLAATSGESAFASDAAAAGMNVQPQKDYIRANGPQNVTFPPEMLVAMFESSKGKIMGPFIADGTAYMFVVHNVGYDAKTREKIAKESMDNIVTKLREASFEELMLYTTGASNMKMKVTPDQLVPNNKN